MRFLPRGVAALLFAALALTSARPASGVHAGPILTARPRVTGDATQGRRLVVARGSWSGTGSLSYAYTWFRCDPMGRRCRVLRGDTTSVHWPSADDVGHTLSVAVRATDSAGSTLAFASLVGPVGGLRLHVDSLAQPLVVGSAVEGETVHVGTGSWRPQPSALEYQWARCSAELRACAAIGGQTGTAYKLGPADLGHTVVAIVQARSGASSRAVFSSATGVVVASGSSTGPTSTTPPAVAEVLQQGNVLTGSVGSWQGAGSVAYEYSWYRCDAAGASCEVIHGATAVTHELTARDVGHTLGFAVHATDAAGTTTRYAALVGPVAAAGAPLVSTAQPTIGGSAVPGRTLRVSSGGWSQAPSAVAFQWERCNTNGRLCAPIGGATASTYVVAAADSGHSLVAVVHATAGAAAEDALSGATAVVAAAPDGPSSSVRPTVAGTTEQGARLEGSAGTWTGAGAITYAYNWFRCDTAGAHCLSIHGATKPTYTEVAADVGHTLGFVVRATDSAGTTTQYADLVGPVAAAGAALASTAQPLVTGTAGPGRTLQVTTGTWSQLPSGLAYQWLRCNPNGHLCVPIAGATATSYVVGAADSGHALLATVTSSVGAVQQPALSTRTPVVP